MLKPSGEWGQTRSWRERACRGRAKRENLQRMLVLGR